MPLTLTNRVLTTGLTGSARVFAAGLGKFGRPLAKIRPERTEISPATQGVAGSEPPQAAVGRVAGSLILDLPLVLIPGESQTRDRITAGFRAMVQTGEWEQLFAAIRQADLARSAAPGGGRLAALISAVAREPVIAAVEAGDLRGAALALDRMMDDVDAPDSDPVAAAVLAQAYLDLADGHRQKAGGAGAFRDLVARAEGLLDCFDPIEEDLPQLAAARYRLVPGLDEAEPLFRDWYEDWSDLDPGALDPHVAHAQHLLPQWFGNPAEFDGEARAAARRTCSRTGLAAYALFHLTGARAMGSVLPGLDPELLLQGLGDLRRLEPGQMAANRLAADLADLALTQEPGSTGPQAGPLSLALCDHLRRGGLTELHLSAFSGNHDLMHAALWRVFGAELEQGARLVAGPTGIAARMGRQD